MFRAKGQRAVHDHILCFRYSEVLRNSVNRTSILFAQKNEDQTDKRTIHSLDKYFAFEE